MTKQYEVIKPWFGVKQGQIVTQVGEMFKANVREVTADLGSNDAGDLKAELKAVRSNLTKAENANKSKDEVIAKLQETIKELEAKLTDTKEK